MNILQRVKVAGSFIVKGAPSFNDAGWQEFFGNRKGGTKKGDLEAYVRNFESWVYAAVSCIARNVAKVELSLYLQKSKEKDKWQEVYDHPFLDLYNTVNPYMSTFELKELTQTYLDLIGNAYWYLPTNGIGKPGEIWPLLAHKVKPVAGTRVLIDHYEYNLGGKVIIFSPDEILHFRYANPNSLITGLSPLQAVLLSADTNKAMMEHSFNTFESGAFLGTVIEAPAEMSPMDYERLKTDLRQQHTGVENAGKTKIFKGAKLNRVAQTMAELGYIEGRKLTKDDILRVYGVPDTKLGGGESGAAASRATAFQLEETFTGETIQPRLIRLSTGINQYLLPKWDDRLWCEFEDISPSDKEFNLSLEESRLKTGYYSINEKRAMDGLEPVVWGDKPWIPLNLTQPIENGSKSVKAGCSHSKEQKEVKSDIDWVKFQDLKKRFWYPWVAKQEKFEKQYIDRINKYWGEQHKMINGNIARYLTDKAMKTRGDSLRDLLFPSEQVETDRFIKMSEPLLMEWFESGVQDGIEQVGKSVKSKKDIDWDLIDPHWREYFKSFSTMAEAVTQETVKKFGGVIEAWLESGEGVTSLQKAVQGMYGDMEAYRALRIARTESARALNQGRIAHYKELGIQKQVWCAELDHVTCEFCEGMDGKEGDVDGLFDGGIEAPPTGSHPSCRCLTLAKDLITQFETEEA